MFKRGGLRLLILSACAIVATLYLYQRHGTQVQLVQQRIYECLSDGSEDGSEESDTSPIDSNKSRGQRSSGEGTTDIAVEGRHLGRHQRPRVTVESEMARRQLRQQAWELFYTMERLDITGKSAIVEQGISYLADFDLYNSHFGDTGVEDWHRHELSKLTAHIQASLERLQHPPDCSTAHLMLCDLNQPCGLTCQIHHLSHYLTIAAISNRTLVLVDDGAKWSYSPHGWSAVFDPIGKCTAADAGVKELKGVEMWLEVNQTTRVVQCPSLMQSEGPEDIRGRPEQSPMVVPTELRDALFLHHENPYVFFAGQFKHFLMRRLNSDTKKQLSTAKEKIFRGGERDWDTVVGVHIRRTDKVNTESTLHPVGEYMRWVDYWYRVRDRARQRSPGHNGSITPIHRRVYVASDDPTVVNELRNGTWQSGEGPKYEFLANANSSNSAQLIERYSENSLRDALVDIHLLTQCAHLVCTFSSTVCRSVYELMLVQRVVEGRSTVDFHSLDFGYLYAWQKDHELIAVEEHQATKGIGPAKQIAMEVGDVVLADWYYWRIKPEFNEVAGWTRGESRRTKKKGFFPNYKVTEKWRIASFPIFKQESASDEKH